MVGFMSGLIKGFKEAIIPTVLIVVVPTTFLGFLLSGGNISQFFFKALPLIVLLDCCANVINNYSDWEIDVINKKRPTMHRVFKKGHLLLTYFLFLPAIAAIMLASATSIYLWIIIGLCILAGLFYSTFVKLKDALLINYAAIAVSYSVLAFAIGFFSGSSDLAHFWSLSPIWVFLMLVYFGYSMTKDYPDIIGDKMHGRRTLPVVFGKDLAIKIQYTTITLAYVYLGLMVFLRLLGVSFLLLFVSYILAIRICMTISKTGSTEKLLAMHYKSQQNALVALVIIIILVLLHL